MKLKYLRGRVRLVEINLLSLSSCHHLVGRGTVGHIMNYLTRPKSVAYNVQRKTQQARNLLGNTNHRFLLQPNNSFSMGYTHYPGVQMSNISTMILHCISLHLLDTFIQSNCRYHRVGTAPGARNRWGPLGQATRNVPTIAYSLPIMKSEMGVFL